jgi:hypothetical protein
MWVRIISRCILQTRIKLATQTPLHRKRAANAPQMRRKRAANAPQTRRKRVAAKLQCWLRWFGGQPDIVALPNAAIRYIVHDCHQRHEGQSEL